MKCKYRLTALAKSDLQLVAWLAVVLVLGVPMAILGIFFIGIAVSYPFSDTSAVPVWIDIVSWSVYITTTTYTVLKARLWLIKNTERISNESY